MQTIPRGDSTKGPADMFTGDLYFDVIAKGEEPSRMRVKHGALRAVRPDRVDSHARGQTLHVTDGIGLVQSRGGEVVVMRPGDTVYTPPGEWHWHEPLPPTSWFTSRCGKHPSRTPGNPRPNGAST